MYAQYIYIFDITKLLPKEVKIYTLTNSAQELLFSCRWLDTTNYRKCSKLSIIILMGVLVKKEGREKVDNDIDRKYPNPT